MSACLLGVRCRYNGKSATNVRFLDETDRSLVPVCPEEAGGLGTPRPAASIVGGDGHDVWEGRARVVDENGRDVTEAFCEGARKTLEAARQQGATRAFLKSRSPSCGCGRVYVDGELQEGDGVTTALLKRNGIEVVETESS